MAEIIFPPFLVTILNFSIKGIFGGHREFLHKMKKHILEKVQERAIWMKLLTHRISAESIGNFPKIVIKSLLVTILNFYGKCKNTFVLEMVSDRVVDFNKNFELR